MFKAHSDLECANDSCPAPLKKILEGTEYTWARKGEKRYYHIKCTPDYKEDGREEGVGNFNCVACNQAFFEDSMIGNTCKTCNYERERDKAKKDGMPIPEVKLPIPQVPTPTVGLEGIIIDLVNKGMNDRVKSIEDKVDNMDGLEDKVKDIVQTSMVGFESEIQTIIKKQVSPVVRIEIKEREEIRKVEGIRHFAYSRLMYYLSKGFNVYLFGPTGSGKSHHASLCAQDFNTRYGYLSLNPQTPDSRIIGCKYADGMYRGTLFREFYENGGLFCFDEVDNTSSALMATLNSAIGNGVGAFPDVMVDMHKDFKLVCTGNTAGLGANPAYPERRPLDVSIRARFAFIDWGYDSLMERRIIDTYKTDDQAQVKTLNMWTEWFYRVRLWGNDNMPRLVTDPRVMYRLADMTRDNFGPCTIDELLDDFLFKGLDTSAKQQVIGSNPLPR